MEVNYYSLGSTENNRLVKIFQIFFGVVCVAVAVFWLIFNAGKLKSDGTLWITFIFLIGFGVYQIWSGLGHATRFIEISPNSIRLKKNAVLGTVQMLSGEMEKIDFFPLSVIFYLKSKKKILLRFGIVYYETNEKIVDRIMDFAETNNIPFEVIEEKL